ncbi:MAG: transglutaminase-like domain-containing protein [Patescibacteria group bacterium]
MFKKVFIFLLFAIGYSLFVNSVLAESEFTVDSTATYKVQESGKTIVTHDITLENNFSTLYATSYTLSLENIEATNVQAKTVNGGQLTVSSQKENNSTNIKITFDDAVVGKGKQRHFFVSYENSSFAVRTGEIWEISIPRLGENSSYRNYIVNLAVPSNFGLEAYISPQPEGAKEQEGVRIYEFSKDSLIKTGVTAGFGNFQVFTYTLNYHLENPLGREAQTEIAIPPDTAYQKVYINSINPAPESVRIDSDGNWLALYKLNPRQRIDIVLLGEVQIFASERPFPAPSDEVLSSNLKETIYWQSGDPAIKSLAASLKTPREIFNFVSTKLKYDFNRVRPNVERLGAVAALQMPNSAICMEFTDLFIAIARAAGIPAREINGYAYTENPNIQPLSLVADVLHSWPEYWSYERNAWIPVDPTWTSTTGGVDFFDKLDLRHFTFVIHGSDPVMPYAPGSYKLGDNPQKDVFVSFGKLKPDRSSFPEISAKYNPGIFFFGSTLNIKIKNPGPVAFYSLYPEVFFDGKSNSRDFIEVLAPLSTYESVIKIPYSFLGRNTPSAVSVVVEGSEIEVPTNKNKVIIGSLLGLFIFFSVFIIVILVRWKKITLKPFLKLLGYIFSRLKGSQSTSGKP